MTEVLESTLEVVDLEKLFDDEKTCECEYCSRPAAWYVEFPCCHQQLLYCDFHKNGDQKIIDLVGVFWREVRCTRCKATVSKLDWRPI